MLSQYPLNVMKSWIVWEEKWCPCDTNTTWNIRRFGGFIISRTRFLLTSLADWSKRSQSGWVSCSCCSSSHTLYSHNTVDISLGCLPDFLTTEPCGYHILQQHGQMGISPLENTYSIVFYCVMWCVWRVSEFILLGFKIFCILCFSPR